MGTSQFWYIFRKVYVRLNENFYKNSICDNISYLDKRFKENKNKQNSIFFTSHGNIFPPYTTEGGGGEDDDDDDDDDEDDDKKDKPDSTVPPPTPPSQEVLIEEHHSDGESDEQFEVVVCTYVKYLFLLTNFYAPGLKGPPGASSNQIIRLFVRLSVRPFVCPSVCP